MNPETSTKEANPGAGAATDAGAVTKASADFESRRVKLAKMSDAELKTRFWELAGKIVDPLVELGRTHTSPSIERSVLMRMGFSSVEARAIADRVAEAGLLSRGAGHVVWRISKLAGLTIREAGLAIINGRDLGGLFDAPCCEPGCCCDPKGGAR